MSFWSGKWSNREAGMLELTNEKLEWSLRKIKIANGDGLLIHSAIQMLGMPTGGVQDYVTVLQNQVTDKGTLVVPTFTLDYPRTQKFDRQKTPSKGMGSLSEYVRQLPGAIRSSHPLQSVAALGYYASDLAGRDTPSAFERDSVFARMLDLDFKLLLLGAGIQAASMVHYCEAAAGVPYRRWMNFTGQIMQNGRWVQKTYKMYARILEIDPQLELQPIQLELERLGAWQEVSLNYGKIASCKVSDFVSACMSLLQKDPWVLVSNKIEARHRLDRLQE
jgi:aminoglycoside 3-N-acetyltransferase